TVEWHDGGHEVRPNEIEAARRLFAPAPAAEGGK
ncbi:MAG: alpha/beta hydrolase, partial [Mesorhizobium sp.]